MEKKKQFGAREGKGKEGGGCKSTMFMSMFISLDHHIFYTTAPFGQDDVIGRCFSYTNMMFI